MRSKCAANGSEVVVKECREDAEVEGATGGVVGAVCGGIGEEYHLGGEGALAHYAHTVFGDEDAGGTQFGVVVGEEGKCPLLLEGALKGLSDFFSPVGRCGNKGGRDLHVTLVVKRCENLYALPLMDIDSW